jgi:hypothetical protein
MVNYGIPRTERGDQRPHNIKQYSNHGISSIQKILENEKKKYFILYKTLFINIFGH